MFLGRHFALNNFTKGCFFIPIFCLYIFGCNDRDYDSLVKDEVIVVDKAADLKKAGKKITEGKVDDAMGIFTAVLKEDEANVDANAGLASIYLSTNQFSEAIKHANVALEKADTDYQATFNSRVGKRHLHLILAQAYFYSGDFNKSNDQIRQVVNRNVDLPPDALAKELQRLAS